MKRRTGLLACVSIALCACALPSAGTEDAPAVIATPNATTRSELQGAVSTLVGKSVTLADDALTQTSSLVIDRTVARDSSGRRIEARENEMPDRLRLVRRQSACVLINERTQQELVLSKIGCRTTVAR